MRDIEKACQKVCSDPEAIASLLVFLALREARRYKWINSKKAGKDLGSKEAALWFKKHFSSWYRDKWVSHIFGEKF